MRLGDTRAVIAHAQLQPACTHRPRPDIDVQGSPLQLAGVLDQIAEGAGQIVGTGAQAQRVVQRRYRELHPIGKRGAHIGLEGVQHLAQRHQGLRGAFAAHEAQHGFDQPFHVPETLAQTPRDAPALCRRQVRAGQLREVQGGRRQGRAHLMSQTRGHLTHGRQTMPALQLALEFVLLGGVGNQHHRLTAIGQRAALHGQLTAAAACAAEFRIALQHVAPGRADQRRPQQFDGRRVGVADGVAGIEQKNTAGQHGQQRREALEQALFLFQLLEARAVADGQFGAQAQDLILKLTVAGIQFAIDRLQSGQRRREGSGPARAGCPIGRDGGLHRARVKGVHGGHALTLGFPRRSILACQSLRVACNPGNTRLRYAGAGPLQKYFAKILCKITMQKPCPDFFPLFFNGLMYCKGTGVRILALVGGRRVQLNPAPGRCAAGEAMRIPGRFANAAGSAVALS